MLKTYPKYFLYQRIVQAKLFMDTHFSESLDLDNIADEACFSKFHFIRKLFFESRYRLADTYFEVGFDSST
ncbi:MAG: hypothetical protein WBP00_07995 [Saprospiraceae bacterium]